MLDRPQVERKRGGVWKRSVYALSIRRRQEGHGCRLGFERLETSCPCFLDASLKAATVPVIALRSSFVCSIVPQVQVKRTPTPGSETRRLTAAGSPKSHGGGLFAKAGSLRIPSEQIQRTLDSPSLNPNNA